MRDCYKVLVLLGLVVCISGISIPLNAIDSTVKFQSKAIDFQTRKVVFPTVSKTNFKRAPGDSPSIQGAIVCVNGLTKRDDSFNELFPRATDTNDTLSNATDTTDTTPVDTNIPSTDTTVDTNPPTTADTNVVTIDTTASTDTPATTAPSPTPSPTPAPTPAPPIASVCSPQRQLVVADNGFDHDLIYNPSADLFLSISVTGDVSQTARGLVATHFFPNGSNAGDAVVFLVTEEDKRNPKVVYNSRRHVYFLLFELVHDIKAYNSSMIGVFLDAKNLTVIGDTIQYNSASHFNREPSLLYDSIADQYIASWSFISPEFVDFDILVAHLSGNNGSGLAVNAFGSDADERSPKLVFNPAVNTVFMVFESQLYIIGTNVTNNIGFGPFIILSHFELNFLDHHPTIAWDPRDGGYMIAFETTFFGTNVTNIFMRHLNRTGFFPNAFFWTLSDNSTAPISRHPVAIFNPALNKLMVAYDVDGENGTQNNTKLAILTSNNIEGSLLVDTLIPLNSNSFNEHLCSAAFADTTHSMLITWGHGDDLRPVIDPNDPAITSSLPLTFDPVPITSFTDKPPDNTLTPAQQAGIAVPVTLAIVGAVVAAIIVGVIYYNRKRLRQAKLRVVANELETKEKGLQMNEVS